MGRKPHTKTRTGCVECKRRHLKCDETRPICHKCNFSNRQCEYRLPAPTTRANSIGSHHSPGRPGDAEPGASSLVNADHVELFHLFVTETCSVIAPNETQLGIYRSFAIPRLFKAQFLLDEVIALSACHMSTKRPERATFYCNMASNLQASALAGYREMLTRINSSNCMEVLIFSFHLGLHAFWQIFNPVENDFGLFLDRLAGCIRLLRGVNMVILGWWDTLIETEAREMVFEQEKPTKLDLPSRGECAGLRDMLNQADLSPSSIAVCQQSLDNLQKYFNYEHTLRVPPHSTYMIFTWLIQSTEGFVDLLDQRRPEALILLAYYGVLLHGRMQCWVIRDAGFRLIDHIHRYLGKRWDQWLAWPYHATTAGTGIMDVRSLTGPCTSGSI
ncbi:hypothetical protein F5Y18DRAFT_407246 [Xylariaceae sp. FL1019]|nr:hypothetical protein F5Y18DRAFT_407246 [Xylariaceae sp. FL1019]